MIRNGSQTQGTQLQFCRRFECRGFSFISAGSYNKNNEKQRTGLPWRQFPCPSSPSRTLQPPPPPLPLLQQPPAKVNATRVLDETISLPKQNRGARQLSPTKNTKTKTKQKQQCSRKINSFTLASIFAPIKSASDPPPPAPPAVACEASGNPRGVAPSPLAAVSAATGLAAAGFLVEVAYPPRVAPLASRLPLGSSLT